MTLLQRWHTYWLSRAVKHIEKRLIGAQWHLYLVQSNQNAIPDCFEIACCEFAVATIRMQNLITEHADTPELVEFVRRWREIDAHPLLKERVPDVNRWDWNKFQVERGEMRALLDIWESEHHAP